MRAPISVCMASYNGIDFIGEQIRSVLSELYELDEIIVVDDASTDDTVKLLNSFNDERIRIFVNSANQGPVRSFELALTIAKHDILILADQDDCWISGRVERLAEPLVSKRALLVSSNSLYMNREGHIIRYPAAKLSAVDSTRHLKNVVDVFTGRAGYYGCAMSLHRDLLSIVLPIPKFVESHDLWLALGANIVRSNLHLEEDTLIRRVHGKNASIIRRSLYRKIGSRVVFLLSIAILIFRHGNGRKMAIKRF